MAEETADQKEAPRPQPTSKGKFLKSVRGKIKTAGEWVNEGFQDPPGYKPPEPLSPKSVGKLIDKVLGSEESTKASKNFLERWRGRIKQMKANAEVYKKEFVEKEGVDRGGLALLELGPYDIIKLAKWGDRAKAIVDGITGALGLGILTNKASKNVTKTTQK